MSMAKIGVISLGCAKNQVNCEQMMYRLQEAGHEILPDVTGADVVLINTCGFIAPAVRESVRAVLDAVNRLARCKNKPLLAVAGSAKDSITLEKVEKEPDYYTLPEFNERQEGVANWFKQVGSLDLKAPMEFPEGYYSIKDSMEDLSKNEEALALATKAVKLATNFDIKPGVGMWDMMKRMTPETMAKMINMPDGFIESLNAQLIKIKK
mgnify:CR=1 FL=1